MNVSLEQEQALLDQIKLDKGQFSKLYELFYKDVYRFVYSLIGNKHDSEDITSQTFLKFYEKVADYEWKGISMKNWLFTTARFISYERMRLPKTEIFDEQMDSLSQAEISFVDQIMDKDLLNHVYEEMNKLSVLERETIVLRIWEEMPFKDIAEIQEAVETTVKFRFYRAIEKIKKALDKKKMRYIFTYPFLFTSIKEANKLNRFDTKIPKVQNFAIAAALINKTNIKDTTNKINNMTKTESIIKTTSEFLKTKLGIAVVSSVLVVATISGGAAIYIANNKSKSNSENKKDDKTASVITPTITITDSPVPTFTSIPTPTSTPVPTSTPKPTATPTPNPYLTYNDAKLKLSFQYPRNGGYTFTSETLATSSYCKVDTYELTVKQPSTGITMYFAESNGCTIVACGGGATSATNKSYKNRFSGETVTYQHYYDNNTYVGVGDITPSNFPLNKVDVSHALDHGCGVPETKAAYDPKVNPALDKFISDIFSGFKPI